jgi:hypothetical protein
MITREDYHDNMTILSWLQNNVIATLWQRCPGHNLVRITYIDKIIMMLFTVWHFCHVIIIMLQCYHDIVLQVFFTWQPHTQLLKMWMAIFLWKLHTLLQKLHLEKTGKIVIILILILTAYRPKAPFIK